MDITIEALQGVKYRVVDVMQLLGVSRGTVIKMIKDGKLPGAYKLGESTSPWLIPESTITGLISKLNGNQPDQSGDASGDDQGDNPPTITA